MNVKFTLLSFFLLLFSYMTIAQEEFTPVTWKSIETAISSSKTLADTRDKIQQLKQLALQRNDFASAGRCFYYQLLVKDKLTEDSLYFKNSLFIDSILDDRQSPPLLTAIMHFLKAKRISRFKSRFFTLHNKNLVSSYSKEYDYSALSRGALDTITAKHFDAALQISKQLKNTLVEQILWLSYDPLIFLFKPGFPDIIFAERINTFKTYRPHPEWSTLSQDEFIQLIDTAEETSPVYRYTLQLYQEWIQYHRTTNPEAFYFIETLARKYFCSNYLSKPGEEKKYEQYLQSLIHSPYASVRMHGIYQLCLLWNSLASRYDTYNAYGEKQYQSDSSYRLYFIKAISLFNENEKLLDSFPFMKNILLTMKEKIISPRLRIETYDHTLPGKPMLTLLKFRNILQVYTKIIRLGTFESILKDKNKAIAYFLQFPVIAESIQPLLSAVDYKWHAAFLKLNALQAGRYVVLYSDRPIIDTTGRVDFIEINVTNIAVVNNDQRVFVLNRKTGFPLENANVIVHYNYLEQPGPNHMIEAPVKKVNKDGYVIVKEKEVQYIHVFYDGDTVVASINDPETELPDQVYSEDEYEDLLEYYEDNVSMEVFTDRAIYRPGQTVYYKVIFFVRNPKTGKPLVLNWKNLKIPFFKKLLYKIAVKTGKEKIELLVTDPFSKTMDSIMLLPNKFGSYAGSYVIPKDAATGEWNIEAGDFDQYGPNRGRFKVEEYKRPSFELAFEKPTNELYLGDSFTVKLLTKSFAGAQLGNVQVNYTVTTSGDLPEDGKSRYDNNRILLEGKAFTNEKGELLLNIHDTLLHSYNFNNDHTWNTYYEIEAEAVDATGESHEEKLNLTLSTRPVKINAPVKNIMERNEMPALYISTESPFAGPVKKQVNIRIYKSAPNDTWHEKIIWRTTDTWLYTKNEFQQWFPDVDFNDKREPAKDEKIVYETSLLAGGENRLAFPKDILSAGNYKIEIECREHGMITGTTFRYFKIYDKIANALPDAGAPFHFLPFNSLEKNQTIKWVTGNSEKDVYSIYHLAWYAKTKKGLAIKYEYDIKPEKKGVNEWSYKIPASAIGEVTLTHLYILDNNLYSKKERIIIANAYSENPGIIVEQYRKKLTPGSKETFIVSVKTKNENTVAELMTTMYDASLDKLGDISDPHRWEIPYFRNNYTVNTNWDPFISAKAEISLFKDDDSYSTYRGSEKGLWWANKQDTFMYNPVFKDNNELASDLLKSMPSVSILDANGLNEVVVIGYSTVSKLQRSTLNAIMIRGTTSLSGYNTLYVILDGVPYEGDINKIDVGTITQGLILKGADATALYGSRAANGVLVLSTKGPVQLPTEKILPPPVIRKNFAETAFFYPQVYAGRDGYFNIQFTLPESVTSWKWKMLAHTKKATFAYEERSLFSQLPLMVQPDMPRFLYQGDKIILKSRITNLDSTALTGTLRCTIEDMETGEDISNRLLDASLKNFVVQQTSNTSGAFELSIPPNLLHPLRIKIVAITNTFSDGEEHIIPVLSNKILVSHAETIMLNDARVSEMTINKPDLPADSEPYGLGLFITPKPQAAMINALPFLANYPFNCAEQTFNKLLANAVMIKIVATDTNAQKSIKDLQLQHSRVEFNEKQADELNENTMPWLQLNHSTAIQHQKLVKLVDTSNARRQVEKYFGELKELQNNDGGMTWFKGGLSDFYISGYILSSFGKLKKDNLPLPEQKYGGKVFSDFILRLIGYCDEEFNNPLIDYLPVHYLYARSFWMKEYPIGSSSKQKLTELLEKYWKNIDRRSIGEQSMVITGTLRYAPANSDLYQQALQQLESIRQLSINDFNGIRWKTISDADDLSMQNEEWVVKIAEAFEEAGKSPEVIKGIIQWLLQTRQEHNWSTTKSTADAITLLNRNLPSATAPTAQLHVKDNGIPGLEVTDDLFNGKLYAFANKSGLPFPEKITVQRNATQLASGGINYYYFTANPPVNSTIKGIKITKALYRYNASTSKWDSLTATTSLAIADKIKTVLTIQAPKQLQYVFIEDKRAAALEPSDPASGYEYGAGLSYYKSVRDVGYQFFASKIPSGIFTISYETVVAKTGTFSNGPASLQCMYQPAARAYSSSSSIIVK